MASHLSIKNKRPFEELSSQQLIDCSRFNFTKEEKCGKNSIVEALIYVDNSGGLTTSKEYPDSKNSDRKCLKYSKEKLVKNTRVGFIRNEIGILETLKNRGPVAVKIPAFRDLFDYKKGIYYKKNCSKFKPNHLMIIVGYGYDSKTKTPYWILKNS
jgi:C1A family cysteine protease